MLAFGYYFRMGCTEQLGDSKVQRFQITFDNMSTLRGCS